MIDTPEMNYNKGEPMPYAEDAKAFTIDLLEKAESVELLLIKDRKQIIMTAYLPICM